MDSTIFVIDDDDLVLRAIESLMESVGYKAACYSSSDEFLLRGDPSKAACLILDVRMPRMSGLELHRHLRDSGLKIPTIFISAYDTAEVTEKVQSSGAIAFLRKPFNDADLLDAIALALRHKNAYGVA